jgi:hypothetical protein
MPKMFPVANLVNVFAPPKALDVLVSNGSQIKQIGLLHFLLGIF